MGKSPNKPKAEPDSESTGLSLDQLSQAFATMLGEASDATTPLVVVGEANLTPDKEDPKALAASEHPPPSTESTAADDSFPVNPRTILEAMLFVGRPDNMPLTDEQMADLMRGVSAEEIDQYVRELNIQYSEQGCPYSIASEGAGYRLVLRPEFGPVRERMLGRTRAARLSPAAIEVLALVAYNEPLTSAEVTRLRGVPSSHILTHLVRRRLLRLERVEPKSGKAKYLTTRRFLEVFHLSSLEDLPRSEDLAKH